MIILREKLGLEEYLKMPAIGSGTLHTLLTKSPYHAWFQSYLNPNRTFKESAEMDAGTIAHSLLLEGDESRLCVIQADDWRTKAAKEARDQAYAQRLTPILERKLPPIREMVETAKAYVEQSEIAGIFQRGKPEVAAAWKEGDVVMRLRADWLTDDRSLIVDLKTTATSAEPNTFIRQMLNMGLDMQCALYCRGMERITGNYPRFVFLVVENEPPYACSLIGLAPSMLDLATRKVESAIAQWQACLRTGKWPGYSNRIAWAESPTWAAAQWEEREAELGEIGLIPGTGTWEPNPDGVAL